MEEQLSNAGTAAMMNKLSATLVGLEESVLAAADCSVMPGCGQDADCTIGNQTLGGGVPMEVSFNIVSCRKDFHIFLIGGDGDQGPTSVAAKPIARKRP